MLRFVSLALAALMTGCLQPDEISIDDAWVRLAAVKGNPAAAYFTVHGGPVDATIVTVSSDVSLRSEMHESMSGGGSMASMRPLRSVRVPALTDVKFAPGGKHVMLYDVNSGIKPGGRPVLLTLHFADGTRISRKAQVLGAGDPAPE